MPIADDIAPANASPDISETSQEPQPSIAFASCDALVRNKRISSSGAQVQAATRSFTTALSVCKFTYFSKFTESLIKRFCAEVQLNTEANIDFNRTDANPSLSTKKEIRHGMCIGKICNNKSEKRCKSLGNKSIKTLE
ncbi:MAG: hypothetical protein ACD_21C00147G0001 [uncultured bacterium]|nr:MAG: hypothetical protein ACD_21C00147G0001 [uncultured bacterium]